MAVQDILDEGMRNGQKVRPAEVGIQCQYMLCGGCSQLGRSPPEQWAIGVTQSNVEMLRGGRSQWGRASSWFPEPRPLASD